MAILGRARETEAKSLAGETLKGLCPEVSNRQYDVLNLEIL